MNYIEVNFTINPVQPFAEILTAELSDLPFDSFVETETGLLAYIPVKDFNEDELKSLEFIQQKKADVKYSIKEIETENWNEKWESNFPPVFVNEKCTIRAPFHEKKQGIDFDILVSPKMAFGTGHHQTTAQVANRLFSIDLKNKSLLDMGCGTAILAIIAQKLGANPITAIDIDEWATENALENCSLNQCDNIEILTGDASLLPGRKFDVIIANINRNILLQDMHQYADCLNNNGILLLSGFYEEDIPVLLQEAAKYGLKETHRASKDKWSILELIKLFKI
ncbi:MAG: ribosomal protein L11 methyltransferase [Bacteroidia bacterium]|nr:MAG: ribosomal protein L11 methyltransferase [Bacteroidia bacterium]